MLKILHNYFYRSQRTIPLGFIISLGGSSKKNYEIVDVVGSYPPYALSHGAHTSVQSPAKGLFIYGGSGYPNLYKYTRTPIIFVNGVQKGQGGNIPYCNVNDNYGYFIAYPIAVEKNDTISMTYSGINYLYIFGYIITI